MYGVLCQFSHKRRYMSLRNLYYCENAVWELKFVNFINIEIEAHFLLHQFPLSSVYLSHHPEPL